MIGSSKRVLLAAAFVCHCPADIGVALPQPHQPGGPEAHDEAALPHTLKLHIEGETLLFKLIEPGTFIMGQSQNYSAPGSTEYRFRRSTGLPVNEGPERQTIISDAYYILDTEVWTSLYCLFLNEQEDPQPFCAALVPPLESRLVNTNGDWGPRAGCETLAANCVTWRGADQFCDWLSQKSGHSIVLPTEAQWAFAARGPESWLFPWGLERQLGIQYFDSEQMMARACDASPVRSYEAGATPTGIYDFLGGVPEWVRDCYRDTYDLNDDTDPYFVDNDEERHVLRGRMWLTFREGVADQQIQDVVSGFRICLESSLPSTSGKACIDPKPGDDEASNR